jgi:hypothetical protein
MSRDDRILAALATRRRLCDDCLSEIAGVRPRQSVYQACTALREQGILSRLTESCEGCNRMKITNASLKATGPSKTQSPIQPVTSDNDPRKLSAGISVSVGRPWSWEGNVQDRIVTFLRETGIAVHSQSDTASREQGKDIVAMDSDGKALWVSVKGFPENSPNTQARHWFAAALLDMALYRSQNSEVRLALGFPAGFKTYESLVNRTSSTLNFLGCHVFWVNQAGSVVRKSSV